MLLAGCKLTAVEARDCGLVTDVFSHDKFTEEVQNRTLSSIYAIHIYLSYNTLVLLVHANQV